VPSGNITADLDSHAQHPRDLVAISGIFRLGGALQGGATGGGHKNQAKHDGRIPRQEVLWACVEYVAPKGSGPLDSSAQVLFLVVRVPAAILQRQSHADSQVV
jgi:hypothetical protein